MELFLQAALINVFLAALLAGLVALIGRFCKRPALMHALWLLVYLKLLTPPLLPITIPWPSAQEEVVPSENEVIPLQENALVVESAMRAMPQDVAPIAEETSKTSPSPTIPKAEIPWRMGILALWGSGAVLWWALAWRRGRWLARLLPHADQAPTEVRQRVEHLAQQMGLSHTPEVRFIRAPVPPLLWAVLGPARMILPTTLWDRLGEEQKNTLLAHELAHLRRGDHWVRRLEILLGGLYWWNPIVWWARRALREVEEQCCDAWVVSALPSSASAYATALLETVTFLSHARRPLPVVASGVSPVKSLQRRFVMILSDPQPRKLSWLGLVAVCALGLLCLPLLPTRAAPPQSKQTTPPIKKRSQGKSFLNAKSPLLKPIRIEDAKKELEHLRVQVDRLSAELNAKKSELVTLESALADAQKELQSRLRRKDLNAARARDIARLRTDLENYKKKIDPVKSDLTAREQELLKRQRDLLTTLEDLRNAEATLAGRLVKSGAAALFIEKGHNFGTLKSEDVLAWSANMVNKSKTTYRISGVRVSDVALMASARSKELKPGERGTISVWLDPKRVSGAKTYRVYVTFKDPKREQVALEIHAKRLTNEAMQEETRINKVERQLQTLIEEVSRLRKELREKSKR